MKRDWTGKLVSISTVSEVAKAFIPNPLPPEPPIVFTPGLQELNDRALFALGRLDSATAFLPEAQLFLYQYIRKEALLSSQIEGTQSSLSDLLLFELNDTQGIPIDDVREISLYIAALEHGIRRFKGGFPLSSRLLNEIHGVLLGRGRGSEKNPGEFRRSQNWIGGTRPGNAIFVPPPHESIADCMGELEYFLNNQRGSFNPLIKSALAHAQFETIHPYLDGNGRLGRLLITLILVHDGLLSEPLLYLSLFFKQHRQQYYDLLQRIRIDGDWEAWIAFFLEAVASTAEQGVTTAQRLNLMAQEDRDKIRKTGRSAGSALRTHHELLSRPIATVGLLRDKTSLVTNTVLKALETLIEIGIVEEITGRRRNKAFVYRRCFEIIKEGTEQA